MRLNPSLQIRRYPYGRSGSFRSVRDLGRFPPVVHVSPENGKSFIRVAPSVAPGWHRVGLLSRPAQRPFRVTSDPPQTVDTLDLILLCPGSPVSYENA